MRPVFQKIALVFLVILQTSSLGAASAPVIAGISPNSTGVGSSVYITGSNFGATKGSSTVTFNGVVAGVSPKTWSNTALWATVPSGAATGNVLVAVNGVASNGFPFTVTTTPSIAWISLSSQGGGLSVYIMGSNFGATQGASTVTFNGVTATATNWSITALDATVPSGITTGNFVVTVNGVASNAFPFSVIAAGGFEPIGALGTARFGATGTLLANGMVLITGGVDSNGNTLASAELYDPAEHTGIFEFTGSLNAARSGHTATLLNNGQVLIVGGKGSNNLPLASAELYDPATASFTPTGSMSVSRIACTATLLNNGTVLVAGGTDGSQNAFASAELYNPTAGTFTLTGSLNSARYSHTATPLNNGMVLIAGGLDSNSNVLASAELYSASTGTLTVTGSLITGRALHTATLLNTGKVLIAGGLGASQNVLASAELYDPIAGSFAATGSLSTGRDSHASALLNNGGVVIAGGLSTSHTALASTEVYDAAAGTFSPAGGLHTARSLPTTAPLTFGMVLAVGGAGTNNLALASAELYQPAALAPPGLVSIAISPSTPAIAAGASQKFTATGTFGDSSTQTLASVTWSSSDSTIVTVTDDATNRGNAFGVAQGSATVSACTGSVCGSTTIAGGAATSALPQIMGLAPGSGTAGSWVLVAGEYFGATQGSSGVTFGGASATVESWSDGAVVVAVPAGLTSGQSVPVVVSTASGSSNSADFIPVSTSAPYRVSPQAFNLLVGQTRTVLVTDASGNPVTGLEWTTTDSNVVSLSADDPPVITAVAPGSAIVYVVGLPILVGVYAGSALPPGTAIWSSPMSSFNYPLIVRPAVPSASGADLFTLDDATFQALSSDGSTIWAAPVARDYYTQLIPDFSGSALVSVPYQDAHANTVGYVLDKFDPNARQLTNVYTFFNGPGPVVPHPSGALFVQDGATGCANGYYSCPVALNVVDGSTGALLGSASIEQNGGDAWGIYGSDIGTVIVAGDGNAYLPYFYTNYYYWATDWNGDEHWDVHLRVLRASPDGTTNKIDLGDWTGDCREQEGQYTSSGTTVAPTVWYHPALSVITNADTGAAIFADLYYMDACGAPSPQTQASFVAQDAVTSQVNAASSSFVPALQREDGSYIGTDGSGNVVALGQDGSVVWQQPIAGATPLYATADGGAIVTDYTTLSTLDQNGNVTSQAPDTGAFMSWTGQWYDPPLGGSTVSAVAWFDLNWGYGTGVFGDGNPSKTQTWTDRCPALDSASSKLIEKANTDVYNFLQSGTCLFCVQKIFTPLKITQTAYAKYLGQGHRFCDGTKSKEPGPTIDQTDLTVAVYFARTKDRAITVSPSKSKELWVFFDPSYFEPDYPYYNDALVFHEGLHGFGGFSDYTLCGLITDPTEQNTCIIKDTNALNIWLENHVPWP